MIKKADVAMNIFAKPWETALSLLSLTDKCGSKIGKIWLQFEPMGCKFDSLNPYLIIGYLTQNGYECEVNQPERWLDLEPTDEKMLKTFAGRSCIRYESAFEKTEASYLFLVHNDVLVFRDILSAMLDDIGCAFAIGQLGQCWNCPASHDSVTKNVMNRSHCDAEHYLDFQPDAEQLKDLYREARRQGIFARPYDDENFSGEFETQPWPLPECRINEWACLLNMDKIREHCVPYGQAWPPGAYRLCAGHTLDIGVAFFRDLHAKNLFAKNMDVKKYMRHWVGTGKNTPLKYAQAEDNAKRIIEKHYPQFLEWQKTNSQ